MDVLKGDPDLEKITARAAHGGRSQGVDAAHLSKIWKINSDEAKHTLEVTTQTSIHKDNPKLLRKYGTNNQMLRYKHITRYFFMDTFFATQKDGKSTQGNY